MRNAFVYYDQIEDQDEQIMGILKYLTEWLVNHILYVDIKLMSVRRNRLIYDE